MGMKGFFPPEIKMTNLQFKFPNRVSVVARKNFLILMFLKTTKICIYETFQREGVYFAGPMMGVTLTVVMNTGSLCSGASQMGDISLITAWLASFLQNARFVWCYSLGSYRKNYS